VKPGFRVTGEVVIDYVVIGPQCLDSAFRQNSGHSGRKRAPNLRPTLLPTHLFTGRLKTRDLLGSFRNRFQFLITGQGFRPPQGRSKVALLAFLSWPFYKTMKVSGSFSLVLVNSAPEKQFANLCQTSAFLLGDLREGNFDLAGDSEPNPFVFGCHNLPGF